MLLHGPIGMPGVVALLHVVGVDSQGPVPVRMATLALEPTLSTGTVVHRTALDVSTCIKNNKNIINIL